MKKAIQNYEKAVQYHNEIDKPAEKAELLLTLGTIYEKQANSIDALDHYRRGLEIFQSNGLENSEQAQMAKEKIKNIKYSK